jgi:hypothetical protein
VERAIRYVRDSFWAGRPFTTLAQCNRQALVWRDQLAHQRPWPGDDTRTVGEVFTEVRSEALKALSTTWCGGKTTRRNFVGPVFLKRAPYRVKPLRQSSLSGSETKKEKLK